MTKVVLLNIARFIGIMLFQVLILNRIELHGFISPFMYPLIILLLPFETPRFLLLFIAFFTGSVIDFFFTNTPGMHASALVFMAYFRSLIITVNRPISDYEPNHKPNMASLGFRWFFGYVSMAIILHHSFYFMVEFFTFSNFLFTLARIVCSAVVSILLIILYEYIFKSRT